MRIQIISMAALALGVMVAPVKAQSINKVAHDVSSTVKKAGRDTKAEVKRDASKAHGALTDAGNDTKTTLGNATGIHKVGGDVGKAAKAVSNTSKKTGRKAKHTVKHAKAAAHSELTKTGKDAKEQAKKTP